MSTDRSRLWMAIRAAGLAAGLACMAYMLIVAAGALRSLVRVELSGMLAALAIGTGANIVIGATFSELLGKSLGEIPLRRRLAAFYYSQIAKYIPGRFASIVIQRSIIRDVGATRSIIVANLELTAVNLALTTAAAVALLAWRAHPEISAATTVVAVAGGALALRVDWTRLLQRVSRVVPALSAADAVAEAAPRWPRSLVLSGLTFILPTLSVLAMLLLGFGLTLTSALNTAGLLLLSWAVGVIAFVFPAGIGVREVAFLSLGGAMSSVPDAGLMAVIAVIWRALQVLIDIVSTVLFFGADRWKNPTR